MCGKLPTGWAGSEPSGRAAAASGSGVPHQGGAMAARPVAGVSAAASASASASRSPLLKRFLIPLPWLRAPPSPLGFAGCGGGTLLDRDGLGQVPGLVDVHAAQPSNPVG